MTVQVWYHHSAGRDGSGSIIPVSARPARAYEDWADGTVGDITPGMNFLEVISDVDTILYIYDDSDDAAGDPLDWKFGMALLASTREWVVIPRKNARYRVT